MLKTLIKIGYFITLIYNLVAFLILVKTVGLSSPMITIEKAFIAGILTFIYFVFFKKN